MMQEEEEGGRRGGANGARWRRWIRTEGADFGVSQAEEK